MITVCCPTLVNYDLLRIMIKSAESGSIIPDNYYVVDNGGKIDFTMDKMLVHRPGYNLGVAASWNVLIRGTKEHRIIVNDDIRFGKDTVKDMISKLESGSWLVMAMGYSCFAIPDKTVELVGYFDEDISPGYGYFEDSDYSHRIKLAGLVEDSVKNVDHVGSATMHKLVKDKVNIEHVKRFDLARNNYIKKWGGSPGSERFFH